MYTSWKVQKILQDVINNKLEVRSYKNIFEAITKNKIIKTLVQNIAKIVGNDLFNS